jgi:C4-type Zn-finger protein
VRVTDEPEAAREVRRECPMCGELMDLKVRTRVAKIPGTTQVVKSEEREWLCSECDYFEEEDPEGRAR